MHGRFRFAFSAPSILLLSSVLSLPAPPAHASCPGSAADDSPAFGADRQLWGELRPMDPGQLPAERDNSDFNQFGSWLSNPYFQSLDIENGWLFTAASQRFQVWNTTPDPGQPQLTADIGIDRMDLLWGADAHAFLIFQDVDAPPGRDDIVALVGHFGTGLVVFDTADKADPRVIYQDSGPGNPPVRKTPQVYSTEIGGRAYAFVAAKSSSGGLLVYDLDAAREFYANNQTRCVEQHPQQDCAGVFLGRIGSDEAAEFVDGTGSYVAVSSIANPYGVKIWDVSNPNSPSLLLDDLPDDLVWGVALWQDGGSYYLALRTIFELRIYDVTCIAQGPCQLGSAIWSQAADFPSQAGLGTVTHSWSEETPILYWGGSRNCPLFPQDEWLQDVSNPAAPREISPPDQVMVGEDTVTYWSWYYPSHNYSGYFQVKPLAGKFHGPYFYRAAFSLLDVHQWTTMLPPVAEFTVSSNPAFVGRDLDLTDISIGLPQNWDWTFAPDATPTSSTNQHPSTVFSTPGVKTISLEVQNAVGTDTTSLQLEVQNPEPASSGIAASTTAAQVCQTLIFTAQDVTGEPPLTVTWKVLDDQDLTVTTGTGNPFIWKTPTTTTAGTYSAEVTVGNALGEAVQTIELHLANPAHGLTALHCDAFELGDLGAWSSTL